MRPSATDWVCLYPCVCVSVGHDREPSKTANTVWAADSSGPKEPHIIWRLGFPIRRATLGGTGTQESKTHARRSQKGWEAGVCTLTWRCKDCAAGVRSVATITVTTCSHCYRWDWRFLNKIPADCRRLYSCRPTRRNSTVLLCRLISAMWVLHNALIRWIKIYRSARMNVLGVYLKRTCSLVTSASSALGVLNDYAL